MKKRMPSDTQQGMSSELFERRLNDRHTHSWKNSCLVEMEENEGTEHESEAWTNAIDRGGLKHVSNMTYMLFVSMELELRQHLHDGTASDESEMKEMAIEKYCTMKMFSFTGL